MTGHKQPNAMPSSAPAAPTACSCSVQRVHVHMREKLKKVAQRPVYHVGPARARQPRLLRGKKNAALRSDIRTLHANPCVIVADPNHCWCMTQTTMHARRHGAERRAGPHAPMVFRHGVCPVVHLWYVVGPRTLTAAISTLVQQVRLACWHRGKTVVPQLQRVPQILCAGRIARQPLTMLAIWHRSARPRTTCWCCVC